MKTIIYVDGFNLYYGSLRKNPQYKWLNLLALSQNVLGERFNIEGIQYFTAQVKSNPQDKDAPIRQNVYLRALATLGCVEVTQGSFIRSKARRRLVSPTEVLITNPMNGSKTPATILDVEVWETNEKGSDVNLATRILMDALDDKFEAAAIITNDSDLVAPVKYVKKKFKKPVYILNPHHINPDSSRSYELSRFATKTLEITREHLEASQFAESLQDVVGTFTKPPRWKV